MWVGVNTLQTECNLDIKHMLTCSAAGEKQFARMTTLTIESGQLRDTPTIKVDTHTSKAGRARCAHGHAEEPITAHSQILLV
jgi:hypothetical protein